MHRLISFIGILAIIGVAFAFSRNRKAVRWRTVGWGFLLQMVFAFLILKTSMGRKVFTILNDVIVGFLNYTREGAGFLFGKLIDSNIPILSKLPDGAMGVNPDSVANAGAFFAFTVLPTIIFFSSFMAVMYHLGVVQRVVKAVAWVMSRTMNTSGAESLSASANIFVGQTEAPLVIRPYVNRMTQSELMAVMTGGFATVAGGVMAAYVAMLQAKIPGIAGHLMAASVMAAPAGLALAKIFVPETETPETAGQLKLDYKPDSANVIDAAAGGASQGVMLAINVGAMLIAFLALVAVINGLLGWTGNLFGVSGLSLSLVFGKVLKPFVFLLGVPWSDCSRMGDLLGTKIMINEFVAYAKLQAFANENVISERTMILASYALCGFANLGSIGIQLGGIGAMAPDRRHDLARLGLRAMAAGAMASCTTACIAGILI